MWHTCICAIYQDAVYISRIVYWYDAATGEKAGKNRKRSEAEVEGITTLFGRQDSIFGFIQFRVGERESSGGGG